MSDGLRVVTDTMGEMRVPDWALWGAETQRAVENFPASGGTLYREMIAALGLVKLAAAHVNRDLGKLDAKLADAVMAAAKEVIDGSLDRHFPVPVYQTGSGTSSNMNANEVIGNRAIQILGGEVGSKKPVHPNDHVNLGQSSNDVFPSATHIAAVILIEEKLLPSLTDLHSALAAKAAEFGGIVKTGRTHLQDATPVRLGQEFSGYASQVHHGIHHIKDALEHLRELALGGTAVGTGINTHPEFGARMAAKLSEITGHSFVEAPNHFEAQAGRDAAVSMSGALKTLASALIKICNDVRWMGSGPRLGLGELELPEVQPGSSIMPGKVNPVIAESLLMASARVIGLDAAITLGGLSGNFELNVMQPLIAECLLEQIRLLADGARNFADKCVKGLQADRKRIESMNEMSLSLATALSPLIGHDRAARIAKRARAEGRTVREVALEEKVLPKEQLDEALNLLKMTGPKK